MTERPLVGCERATVYAGVYVVLLFLAIFALGWLTIIGGNPMQVSNIGVVNSTGLPNDRFNIGDIAGIKRNICADHAVTIQSFPALIDARGFLFALPIYRAEALGGCHDSTYGFIIPDLPAGEYTYTNSALYQNNLVGRNEFTTFPPLRVRIMQ